MTGRLSIRQSFRKFSYGAAICNWKDNKKYLPMKAMHSSVQYKKNKRPTERKQLKEGKERC